MNTLSVLDANTAKLPEGLYLELTNALKKDFENDGNNKEWSEKEKLGHQLYGYNYDETKENEDNLKFLKDHCDDLEIVKYVFDRFYQDDPTGYVYDIQNDDIITLNTCLECGEVFRYELVNSYTDICFECQVIHCHFCKTRITHDIQECRHCKCFFCEDCSKFNGCADCVINEFTKSLSSYATPYMPLWNYIPRFQKDDYLEHIVSASFTKILNLKFDI